LPLPREPSKGRYRSWFRKLGRNSHAERGQALVEFALVATVFFLIVFGIIDFARFFQSWVTVQHAAREAGRYGLTGRTDCDIASDDRLACLEYVAKESTVGLAGAPDNVTVSVRSWDYPDYADPPTEGSAGEQCDAFEVGVRYEFKFAAPIIANALGFIEIPIQGRERVVNEPFGPCQ
jgi:hypothetical protein